jgi:transcriptional regulator with PAS, ATPase and Fis domain
VLLQGESGTGKELFARALHTLGTRRDGPFVAVNCGALPETLLESELFGYKAGAFTDARQDKPGRFKLADKGTIFLDEIGDMAHGVQVKLLRVLQEKVFEPLGGITPQHADVRVVAASNQNLDTLVAQGLFRQDLFYRLNVARLLVPPLRERPEDIPPLINHILGRLRLLENKDIHGVSQDAHALLMRHDYPGNVRELRNILEFASIICPGGFIQVEHLPDTLQPTPNGTARPARTMQEIKCRAALDAYQRNDRRTMAACRELGISKDTMRRLLARGRALGLDENQASEPSRP